MSTLRLPPNTHLSLPTPPSAPIAFHTTHRQRIPVSIDPAYKRNLDLAKAKLKEVNENLDEVPRLLQQVAVSDVFRATGPAKVGGSVGAGKGARAGGWAKLKEVNENLDEVPRLLQQVAVWDGFRATEPA